MNTFLAITYSFLLTFCPYDEVGMGNNYEHKDNATHVEYELGLDLFNMVRFYTGEETLQTDNGSIFNWYPYTQSYFVGVEYHKAFGEKLLLRTGVVHKCQHPVSTWEVQSSQYNSARTEIYLNISGRLDIF